VSKESRRTSPRFLRRARAGAPHAVAGPAATKPSFTAVALRTERPIPTEIHLNDPCNIRFLPPTFAAWAPRQPPDRQVAVLMSGGVDSSVAAHLLQSAGWDVLGVTMKIPVACTTGGRGCCGADAAFVCQELGLPHYFVDVTEAFEQSIIRPFRDAYAQAQTPNPCVDCNSRLKFALVWDLLRRTFGIPRLATGHYARVVRDGCRAYLRRAADKEKDQSYFLYGIAGDRLADLVLPLGDWTKPQVRAKAAWLHLSVAAKAESMELCFAGEQDYRLALNRGETGRPLYVGRIDLTANTVALGTRAEVSVRTVRATSCNVLVPEQLTPDARLFGKIRSYGPPRPCRLVDGGADALTVEFDQPQFAPCPGQRLVLYDERDTVIAGGIICTA
jgi:tRNA-specific 2-thiouridylase